MLALEVSQLALVISLKLLNFFYLIIHGKQIVRLNALIYQDAKPPETRVGPKEQLDPVRLLPDDAHRTPSEGSKVTCTQVDGYLCMDFVVLSSRLGLRWATASATL